MKSLMSCSEQIDVRTAYLNSGGVHYLIHTPVEPATQLRPSLCYLATAHKQHPLTSLPSPPDWRTHFHAALSVL